MNIASLLNAMPGNVAQGMIWGIMALGVFMTYKILDFADLSVDGSFATGGAVTVILMTMNVPYGWALLAGCACGILAGLITGILHTVLGIPGILASILVQIALYSVNLNIMSGKANTALSVDKFNLLVSLRFIPKSIVVAAIASAILIALMYWYFGTAQGSAIRATGNNPAMARAQGINIDIMKIITLALSNGVVAFSGGLLAQYQGFADINMGRGAIVIGLAAVIIGDVLYNALFKKSGGFVYRLIFVVIGGIIYYIVIGFVLWLKMPTNDLKLFQAIVVAVFLAVPYLKEKGVSSFKKAAKNAKKEGN